MFKHMLCGAVVMAAGYVNGMTPVQESPKVPKKEAVSSSSSHGCSRPNCQGDLPGWICKRAELNKIPFHFKDPNASIQCCWKHFST